MAKKYYMKAMDECDPWDIYYSEDDAAYDNLYVCTHYPWENYVRSDISINTNNLSQIVECIYMALDEIDNTYYVADEDDEIDEEEVAKNTVETIKDYVPFANRLSKSQLNRLVELCYDYQDESKNDKILKIFLEILSLLFGEPYISGTFNGYSQGDWAIYICPKALEKNLGYIEACIMGTGTEYAISDKPLDSPEEFEDADHNCEYTELWKENDVKKWAADNLHCSPNDIEIIE